MSLDALQDLVLTVGADLSPVEQQLGELPGIAKQAASDIDSALAGVGTGDAGAGLKALDDAIRGVGESAQHSTPPIHDMDSAIEHAGEEVGGFSEKAMELVGALGLLVTLEKVAEWLKEIATEAVSAYAASEQFTTAMGQLTGSSEQAESMLQQLKTTALQIPVSLQSLESATQRMTAFGVEASKIPSLMQAAANASAATGNSFDTVAQALSRVEISGQVSARQLVQLGVSWKDLAQAMGTSIEEAQERLKKGGQDAEADLTAVVAAINQKFAGAAAAMATTLSGQFQILKNQIEQTLEGLGEAAAPVLKNIMQVVGSEIIPALNDVVHGFTAIAEVISPVVSVPLGQLINAFRDLSSILGSLGTIIKDTSNTLHVFADALGINLDKLKSFWDTLNDVSPLHLMATSLSAAAASFQDLNPALVLAKLNTDRLHSSTQAMIDQAQPHSSGIQQIAQKYNELQAAVDKARMNMEAIRAAQDGTTEAAGRLALATQEYDKAVKALDLGRTEAAHKALADAISQHRATLAQLVTTSHEHDAALAAASATLADAKAKYDAGKISLDQLVMAENQYAEAIKNADPLAKAHAANIAELGTNYDLSQVKVARAKQTVDEAAAALKAATDAGKDASREQAIYAAALGEYIKALDGANTSAKGHGAALAKLTAEYEQHKLAVDRAKEAVKEADAQNDGSAAKAEIARMAHLQLTEAMKQLNEGATAAAKAIKTHAESLDQLNAKAYANVGAMQQAAQNLRVAEAANDGSALATARLVQAQKDYNSAVSAATGATVPHVQSLQQLTMQEDLATAATLRAKDVYEAAKEAFDGTSQKAAVLNKALEQYIKLAKESHTPTQDLTSDVRGLGTALDGVASSAAKAGQAVKSLAESIATPGGLGRNATFGTSVPQSMEALFANFAPYQNPMMSIESTGMTGTSAGENATYWGGIKISEAQVVPGIMTPVTHAATAAISAITQVAEDVRKTATASLYTVSDSADILKKISQGQFTEAIASLMAGGESMQNAFNDVMGAADKMRTAADSVDTAAAGIDAATTSMATAADAMASASGVMAQAAAQTTMAADVIASAGGVMYQAFAPIVAATAPEAPHMSVAALNQYGVNTSLPTGAPGPYVGSGPSGINLTFQFTGTVVGGSAGMRQLTSDVGNAVIDRLRAAGAKF